MIAHRTFARLPRLLGLLLAAAGACASPGNRAPSSQPSGTLAPAPLASLSKASSLDGRIWIASQPTAKDLPAIAEKGVKLVVNLRPSSEIDWDEAGSVRELGMRYLQIPVTVDTLSERDVDAFVAALADPANQPVFVHCHSANRAGALWALYRIRRDGLGLEEAIGEAKTAGMRSPKLEEFVRAHAQR